MGRVDRVARRHVELEVHRDGAHRGRHVYAPAGVLIVVAYRLDPGPGGVKDEPVVTEDDGDDCWTPA
jgi:hypothetical protein